MATNPSLTPSTPTDIGYNEQEREDQNQRQMERVLSRSHRDGNTQVEDLASSLPSNNTSSGGQTWSEFLRDTRNRGGGESNSQRSIDARRSSMMALDRKRRLTGSTDESARRRAASGGIYRHGHPYALIPDGHTNQVGGSGSQSQNWMNSPNGGPSRDMNGPLLPSNQPYIRRVSSAARRSSSIREYVRPPWQPDSEVTKCPICDTQFTFWYRKHHCRKCGRVVCASCSPHRITIPRQFIVQPPSVTAATTSTPTEPSRIEIIDLTDDSDMSRRSSMPDPNQLPEEPPNPALGGGEEVRLCNPCVPDPNPNPPQTYHPTYNPPQTPSGPPRATGISWWPLSSPLIPVSNRAPGYTPRPTTRNPNAWNPPGQSGPSSPAMPFVRTPEERRRRGQGMIVSSDLWLSIPAWN
jgi:hypothetical protein